MRRWWRGREAVWAVVALSVNWPEMAEAQVEGTAAAERFAISLVLNAESQIANAFEANTLVPVASAGVVRNGMVIDVDENREELETSSLKLTLIQKLLFAMITQADEATYMAYMGFEDASFLGYYNTGMRVPSGYGFAHSSTAGTTRNATDFDFSFGLDTDIPCDSFCGSIWEVKEPTGKPNDWFLPYDDYDCRTRGWYVAGLEQGSGVSPVYSFFSGGLGVTGYLELIDPSGLFVGVAGFDFRLAELSAQLARYAAAADPDLGIVFALFDGPLPNVTNATWLNQSTLNATGFLHGEEQNATTASSSRKNTSSSSSSNGGADEDLDDDDDDDFLAPSSHPFLMAASVPVLLQSDSSPNGRVAAVNASDPLVQFGARLLAERNWPVDEVLIAENRFFHLSSVTMSQPEWILAEPWWLLVSYKIDCRLGTYELEEDRGCVECPPGRWTSNSKSQYCDICVPGMYLDERTDTCHDCPSNTHCHVPGVRLRRLPVDEGYMRMHENSTDVRYCIGSYSESDPGDTDVCPGGPDPENVPCDPDSHRNGPRCKLCERDYFERSGNCHRCTSNTMKSPGVVIPIIIYSLLFLVFLVWLFRTGAAEAKHLKRGNKYARLQAKIRTKWRILFVAIQILAAMPDIIDVPYPPLYRKIVDNSVGVLTFDITALVPMNCLSTGSEGRGAATYKSIVTTTFLPFGIMVLLVIYVLYVTRRRAARKTAERTKSARLVGDRDPETTTVQHDDATLSDDTNNGSSGTEEGTRPVARSLPNDGGGPDACDANDPAVLPAKSDDDDDDDACKRRRHVEEKVERRARRSSLGPPEYADSTVRQSLAAVAILIAFCLYPTVSSVVLGLFRACEKWDAPDGNGTELYLQGNYAVKCSGPAYRAFRIYCGMFIIIWVIGVPLCFAIELYRHKKHLDPELPCGGKARMWADGGRQAVTEGMHLREVNPAIAHLSVLYGPYEPYYWWWEVVECLRRLTSTAITMLILPGSYSQIFFAILVSLATLKSAAYFAPFYDDSDDNLFEGLAWITLFAQLIALNLRIHGAGSSTSPLTVAFLVVVLTGIFGGVIYIAADAHREKALLAMLREDMKQAYRDSVHSLSASVNYASSHHGSSDPSHTPPPSLPPPSEPPSRAPTVETESVGTDVVRLSYQYRGDDTKDDESPDWNQLEEGTPLSADPSVSPPPVAGHRHPLPTPPPKRN